MNYAEFLLFFLLKINKKSYYIIIIISIYNHLQHRYRSLMIRKKYGYKKKLNFFFILYQALISIHLT